MKKHGLTPLLFAILLSLLAFPEVFAVNQNTAFDLSDQIAPFWGSTQDVNDISVDQNNSVFLVGGGGEFGKFKIDFNSSTDLMTTLNSGLDGNNLNSSALDSNGNVVYLAGDRNTFYMYFIDSNTGVRLSTLYGNACTPATRNIGGILFDSNSTNSFVFLPAYNGGSTSGECRFNPRTNGFMNFSTAFSFFGAPSKVFASSGDTNIWDGATSTGANPNFANYDIDTNVATNFQGNLKPFWGSARSILALVWDKNVFMFGGGTAGEFFRHQIDTNQTTDLNTAVMSVVDNNTIESMAYDNNRQLFVGGAKGLFSDTMLTPTQSPTSRMRFPRLSETTRLQPSPAIPTTETCSLERKMRSFFGSNCGIRS